MYLVFSHMLKSFDREDLETIWKLVKAKYGSTRPVEDLDLILWEDLKTIVHSLRMQHMHIHMLVEKRYPLTPATVTDMLKKKLQWRIVRIKSFLILFGITAALNDINAVQSKLVLLVNFNENYSKCLRRLEEVTTARGSYYINAAEEVNAASEEVSTAELVSTAYATMLRSGPKPLLFCLIGSTWLYSFSLCSMLKGFPSTIMVLRIPIISACVHAKTYAFDFKSDDTTEDPFFVCGRYLSGPLRSFISFAYRNILCEESDLTITKLRISVLERGVSPIVISNGTSPMDQERSLENPTRGVFRSTLVDLIVGFSFSLQCS
ncbi:hypothetical protein Tco_0088731 [Tanacetum coccineum]